MLALSRFIQTNEVLVAHVVDGCEACEARATRMCDGCDAGDPVFVFQARVWGLLVTEEVEHMSSSSCARLFVS